MLNYRHFYQLAALLKWCDLHLDQVIGEPKHTCISCLCSHPAIAGKYRLRAPGGGDRRAGFSVTSKSDVAPACLYLTPLSRDRASCLPSSLAPLPPAASSVLLPIMADPQEKINPSTEKEVTTEVKPGRDASPVDIRRMSTDSAAAAKRILEHSGDHDEAMKAFANGEDIEVDEATNKRLLPRIDLHMMPLMCVVYGLNVRSTGVSGDAAHLF